MANILVARGFAASSLLISVSCSFTVGQDIVSNYEKAYFCDNHPRCEKYLPPGRTSETFRSLSPYSYPQFKESRNVGDFFTVSQVLRPGKPLLQHHAFLSEIVTQRADTNTVAIWGDGAAGVDNARVWGGFFTARSGPYLRDAQLIGAEIDVLNASAPGVFPNQSKTGLQIVGFGKLNTNAIEMISDGSGPFTNAIMVNKSALSSDGTIIGVSPQRLRLGLNFQNVQFSDSALLISENQPITFRAQGRTDASIFRDDIFGGNLVLRAAPGGLRVVNSENTKTLFYIHSDGHVDHASALWLYYKPWIASCAVLLLIMSSAILFLGWRVYRLTVLISQSSTEAILGAKEGLCSGNSSLSSRFSISQGF